MWASTFIFVALAQVAVHDAEGGTVTVKGRRLGGAVLQWRTDSASGEDACDAPDEDGCTFAVPKGLPADPQALELRLSTGPDAGTSAPFHPSKVIIDRLVPPDAVVDLQAEVSRVPLTHPEAVAAAECTDADCELDGSDLVVRREQGTDELLDVKLRLRPHVFFKRSDAAPAFTIALQRCPVSFASPPVRASREQLVVVKISGRCASSAALELASQGQRLTVLRRAQQDQSQYLVAALPRAGDEASVSVLQGAKSVGIARAVTRTVPPVSAHLDVPGAGEVDFVPLNREAKVKLPVLPGGGVLALLPTEGAYEVRRDEGGNTWVRASAGGGGQVALRFGLRDRSLPDKLGDVDLIELREPVDRRVDVATVPVELERIAELWCGDGEGHPGRVEPGLTAYVPFRARDTCRLVLHRERLKPEDGPQRLQLEVRVVAEDGAARADAASEREVPVLPATAPTDAFLTGIESPFDRLTVRVTRAGSAAQLQWSVVFGTSRLRLFATTSFPSGLFRVADEGHSGILTLNAGAIARLVWLSREGHESPLGVEGGLMWVGIAADTDTRSATRGQIAAVIGAGLSVPIANQGRASQTSISLHGWFEYEISRAVDHSGSPWGFVFGPALTIGDVGTNL